MVLVPPGSQLIGCVGFVEALDAANRFLAFRGKEALYDVEMVGIAPSTPTATGTVLSLPAADPSASLHTFVVGGGLDDGVRPVDPRVLDVADLDVVIDVEDGIEVYNSVYAYDREGGEVGHYDKMVPLPFGEYMPLVDVIPALAKIRRMPNITPGTSPGVLATSLGPSVAFLVCYEATRFRYTRRSVAAGADLLATVTYDGWFGDTGALDQHMMLSAAASAATGVPMVRSATTGISVAVRADGVLLGRSARAERDVLVVDVPHVARPSLYVRLGDWFALACVLLGFVLIARGAMPRRTLVVPTLFLLAATLTWQINPHVGWVEKAVWLVAAGLLVRIGVRGQASSA